MQAAAPGPGKIGPPALAGSAYVERARFGGVITTSVTVHNLDHRLKQGLRANFSKDALVIDAILHARDAILLFGKNFRTASFDGM